MSVVTIKFFHQKLCQRKLGHSVCCHYQSFLIIFVKELDVRIGGKSCKHEKMASTVKIYENIAVTLCLMSIAILRRRLRDRARVRRRATRSWLLRRKQRSTYNIKNCTLKNRTSSEIILEWTKQQFNQFFYDFICPY